MTEYFESGNFAESLQQVIAWGAENEHCSRKDQQEEACCKVMPESVTYSGDIHINHEKRRKRREGG